MLRYGLNHDVATKPKENDVFAFADDIFGQIIWKGLCKDNLNLVQGLKNTLEHFLLTYVVLMINQFTESQKR